MANFRSSANVKTNTPHSAEIVDIIDAVKGDTVFDNVPSQKIYRARLSQSVADVPVVTELFNNTGQTFTYSRLGVGQYVVTASGMFIDTASYYNTMIGFPRHDASGSVMYLERSGSDDYGLLSVYDDAAVLADDINQGYIEIILQQ